MARPTAAQRRRRARPTVYLILRSSSLFAQIAHLVLKLASNALSEMENWQLILSY